MASQSKASESNAAFHREALFDLKGKVALVTGGGSGIGLMAVQALAVNGVKVYIVGRTEEKLERVAELYNKNSAGEIIPLVYDVTKKDQIAALVKEFESKEKHLSVLVNNAGINTQTFSTEAKSADEMKKNLFDDEKATFEDWGAAYHTNVTQCYFVSTAFLPLLQKGSEVEKGWSSTIVNISSISGMVKTFQHHAGYNASKGAIIHLTRMLASEVASNDLTIRINSIAPGVFPSEMTADGSGEDQKSYIPKDKYEDKVPAKRPGKDEDMAQTVLFFVANQYLNGQTLAVDGGYTLAAGL